MSRLGLAISVVFAASVLVESRQICGDAGWCDKECCGNAYDNDGMKCLDSCTGQPCLSDSECGKNNNSCCGDDGVCSGDPYKCSLIKMIEKLRENKPCWADYECGENACCSNGKCHKKYLYCHVACSENSDCSESNCCVDETCQLSSSLCEDFKIPTIEPPWPHIVIPTFESNDGIDGGSYSSNSSIGAGWIILIIFVVIFKVFLFGSCWVLRLRRRSAVIVVRRRCPAPVVGVSPLPAPTYLGSYEPAPPGSHVVDTVPLVDEDHLQQEYERRQEEDATPKTEANNSPCGPPPMYSA